jgi:hypothetical protein
MKRETGLGRDPRRAVVESGKARRYVVDDHRAESRRSQRSRRSSCHTLHRDSRDHSASITSTLLLDRRHPIRPPGRPPRRRPRAGAPAATSSSAQRRHPVRGNRRRRAERVRGHADDAHNAGGRGRPGGTAEICPRHPTATWIKRDDPRARLTGSERTPRPASVTVVLRVWRLPCAVTQPCVASSTTSTPPRCPDQTRTYFCEALLELGAPRVSDDLRDILSPTMGRSAGRRCARPR